MSDLQAFTNPALSVALAMAVGMSVQALARHLRIPGIVLLLAAGVLLGPDGLGLIEPSSLGAALQALVGFAVAVILFEGGMNLDFRRLRREAVSIRRLVTVGALITWVGGALAARLILDWDWARSILFGTLVIVTGPTVINPLLRRIRVKSNLATVLMAEGVLVDAVGAIVAVVALEVVLSPSGETLAAGVLHLVARLGLGTLVGIVAGLVLAFLLRFERLVPDGLENVFTLAWVLAIFQLSNTLVEESGIVVVTAAGIVVGNLQTRALEDLMEFKEQLTTLLIGMLFVLLAADVRLEDVKALGWPAVWTVLALMVLVRPLNVFISTAGSELEPREKAFLSWMAPRGIVAAAVSSLFAHDLTRAGIAGGEELRALVFLVIAATVLIQGLSGGLVAELLGVRRPSNTGYVLLGASPLGLAMGRLLRQNNEEILFLDSNADACHAAEEEGFRVFFGNGLEETLLLRAELETRAGCLAVTSNDEVNLMFADKARSEYKVPLAWVALRRGHQSVSEEMVQKAGARVLFGRPRNIDLWSLRLERGQVTVEAWTPKPDGDSPACDDPGSHEVDSILLPLAVQRGKKILPVDETLKLKKHDQWMLAMLDEKRAEAEEWLRDRGCVSLPT